MYDFGFPFGGRPGNEASDGVPPDPEPKAVMRTLADGTPDPEGEFYVCETCNAVVGLDHAHLNVSGSPADA